MLFVSTEKGVVNLVCDEGSYYYCGWLSHSLYMYTDVYIVPSCV